MLQFKKIFFHTFIKIFYEKFNCTYSIYGDLIGVFGITFRYLVTNKKLFN